MQPEFIYKVAARDLVVSARASGAFDGAPIDRESGYIHFSTAAQLPETLRLHFAGAGDLVLMAARTADLGEGLRFEPSRGGALFPHLYGPLPMSAVVHEGPLAVDGDGRAILPEWVR